MKDVKRAPLPEPTDREIQLEMFKIAKADNLRIKSIKNNLQFIAWYLILSLIIGVFVLISMS